MKRIFITQRAEFNQERQEYSDCLDSKFFELLGDDFYLIPVSNSIPNPEALAEDLNCEGIILSGGNSTFTEDENYSPARQKCEKKLLNYAVRNNIPVVGICYGMQFMNIYCGGRVCEVKKHVKTEHLLRIDDLSFNINSYHKHGIPNRILAEPLLAVGTCDDGTVEFCTHRSQPWLGMMWHPERPIAKQKLWIEMIKKIFTRDLSFKKSDIVYFLRKNYESY